MKPTHLAAAAILGLALPLGAMANHGDMADHIVKKLDLDDARAEEVRSVVKDYAEKRKELKEEYKEQLKNVLTDEEYEKLEAMKEAKREKHKDKKKAPKGKWKDETSEYYEEGGQ